MKTFFSKSLIITSITTSLAISLTACESGFEMDMDDTNEYSIRITNITHAQPLSPPVAILHSEKFKFWSVGEQASVALEKMAEGGDASKLLSLKPENPQYQADSPLFPGESVEFKLTMTDDDFEYISIAGMLINTNDGFSGLNSIELMDMEKGQTNVHYSYTFDAGTEFNSELDNTIPGPADNGEGFNATRDDVTSVVTFHGGVVTADDGFMNSTLSSAEKFNHPALRIEITAR